MNIVFIRFAVVVVTLLIVFISKDIWVIGLLLFISLLVILSSAKTRKAFTNQWKFFAITASLIFLLNTFFLPIPFEERLEISTFAVIRILTITLSSFWFTTVSTPSEFLHLFRFTPRIFQLAVTITFSLIPIIIVEFKTIQNTQRARGVSYSGFHFWKSMQSSIVPLLYRTLLRAEQMARSLESRGWQGK